MLLLGPMRLLPALVLTLPVVAADHPVFEEKGGIVVMEAESTASRMGKWKLRTSVDGFSGSGHLEFTGNKPESGPPNSPAWVVRRKPASRAISKA